MAIFSQSLSVNFFKNNLLAMLYILLFIYFYNVKVIIDIKFRTLGVFKN